MTTIIISLILCLSVSLVTGEDKGETQLSDFSPLLIRENLKSSWDSASLQRLDNRLPSSINITYSEPLDHEGRRFRVSFSDGASGEFTIPPNDDQDDDITGHARSLWGPSGSSASKIEGMLMKPDGALRFKYSDIMGDQSAGCAANRATEQLGADRTGLPQESVRARMDLMEALRKYGIAIIEESPAEPDISVFVGDTLVGAVETTAFGYKFIIKKVADAHNLAFHNIGLQQHTDFTYLKKVPDVALFHCIQNADVGGDSLWVDSFAIAEKLREIDPQAFEMLVNTNVRFVDLTDKWDMWAYHPTIELNHNGEIERVYFNERTRDSWRHAGQATSKGRAMPQAVTAPFYEALRKFEALVDNEEWYINTPLKPGDIALFDNARVMHSRTEFIGNRYMEGTYISWESIEATWRALKWQKDGTRYNFCGNIAGLVE